MRGGGLASARVKHFGLPRAGEELLLVRAGTNAPAWVAIGEGGARVNFTEARARLHLKLLLSEL